MKKKKKKLALTGAPSFELEPSLISKLKDRVKIMSYEESLIICCKQRPNKNTKRETSIEFRSIDIYIYGFTGKPTCQFIFMFFLYSVFGSSGFVTRFFVELRLLAVADRIDLLSRNPEKFDFITAIF